MRTLAVCLVLSCVAFAHGEGIEELARGAYESSREGRYDEAVSAWHALSDLNAADFQPEANEALALRDAGNSAAALPVWIKASLLENADGFVWNQRAWSFLAIGRPREARESFQKAIDRSNTNATQAEAYLGLGMSALSDDKPRVSLDYLKHAAVAGPYAISASAQMTAQAALALGDKQTALTFLRQAIDVDPSNREALRGLARLLDKIGDNRAAWRAARRALVFDPRDEEARKILERNASYIVGDPDAASGVRRIARPVLDAESAEPALPVSARSVRVGLYGAPDGRPATITRCYFMVNSAFKATSAAYGTLRDDGPPFSQWEIEYRPENGSVEVRDSSRNILFVAKQPFRFVPNVPRGSVLIKSAKIPDVVGVDVGDREVRGALEVVPNPWGFKLIQEVPLELYLYGVVSVALPEGSPPEAYKVESVVARTAAAWAMGHHASTPERADVLDDTSLQPTIGVSGELRAGAEAVAATHNLVLADEMGVARAPQHEDSGGRTENGAESGGNDAKLLASVSDAAKPLPAWRTALDLERFVHETPPQGLYSEASPRPTPSSSRWMRVIDAKDLRLRVETRKDVGALRRLRVAGRTSSGRVKAVEVIGSNGSVTYTGHDEIQSLLSPGSLNSTLFTVQPLMDGKKLARIVLWGAGQGSGLGLPRAGAVGQAATGKNWREILQHYFPHFEIRDLDRPSAPAIRSPKPTPGPYRRTLNFRQKK